MVAVVRFDCQTGASAVKFSRAAVAVWVSLLAVNGLHSGFARATENTKRSFTVKDSIELAYFGDLDTHVSQPGEDGVYSPDGRHYARITHQGVVSSGETEATIWIFETSSIRRYLGDANAGPMPEAIQ